MVESPPTVDAAEQPVESFVQSRANEEAMTNDIKMVRDQIGEHLRDAMGYSASCISLERLSTWAGILSRHIEQQPEQGSEGRDRSDESDVQSAAIESEVKEAESAWCRCYRKLQIYIDEDKSVDNDYSRIYGSLQKIRELLVEHEAKRDAAD